MLSFFLIIVHHFCFQWCKNFPKNGKVQFSSFFFICFYHFFTFFFIFASSGEKFSKKWKIAIFLEFLSFFIFFHFFSLLYYFSSFLHPVVQKFSKKWKIEFSSSFFSCFYHVFFIVLSCFIIFASSSAKKSKKWKIAMFLEIVSFFIMFNHFLCFLIIF